MYNDPEVMRFLSTFARNLDDARAIVQRRIDHQERHGFTLWAVVEKATAGLIGACGLKYLDDGPEIEVGYHLARPAWGKGYATEAARACLCHGFDRLGLPRIVAGGAPPHPPPPPLVGESGLDDESPRRFYHKRRRD